MLRKALQTKRQLIEELNKRLLGEQNWVEKMGQQGNANIDASNIKTRFTQELFDKVKAIADKVGMGKFVNDLRNDNSFYMWSKDLGNNNKLQLILANPSTDKVTTSWIGTYVDREGGESATVKSGELKKLDKRGGMGTYPSWDNIVQVSPNLLNRIEPEITRVTNVFK
jgi:hypothetical protein